MNLNSDTWRTIVFEGKNQEYGAYYLRKTSTKRHLYALVIVCVPIIIATISLLLFLRLQEVNGTLLEPVNYYELKMMEDIYLQQQLKPKTEKTPPLEEIKKPTPPKIVNDDEEIIELEDKIIEEEILAELINVTDTTTNSDQTIELTQEIRDELTTYTLNETDSTQGFQSLQTTILRYVHQNIRYPNVAHKQKIKGCVVYSFIINEDGSISEITLVRGVYIFLDEEVLRVIKSMPKYEAVKKDGKAIKVKFYLPVTFAL